MSSRWVLRAVLVALLLIVMTSLVRPVAADGPSRLLLWGPQRSELMRKLRAEALAIGFVVVERDEDVDAAIETTDADLASADAAAAVKALPDGSVAVRVGRGAAASAHVLAPNESAKDSFATVVVEDVRAGLVELDLWIPQKAVPPPVAAPPPTAPSAPAAPPSAPAALAPPRSPSSASPGPGGEPAASQRDDSYRFRIGGGLAGTVPAGGFDPTLHGLVGARLEPTRRWGFGLLALLPLVPGSKSATEGEIDASATAIAAQLDVSPWIDGPWRATVGIGSGPLFVGLDVDPADGFKGNPTTLVAGLHHIDLGFGRDLGSWARVEAILLIGFSAPRPVVEIDGEEAAAWGRFFGTLGLRADFGFPPRLEEPAP